MFTLILEAVLALSLLFAPSPPKPKADAFPPPVCQGRVCH